MAKPLFEQITAALAPGSRAETIRALIPVVEAEQHRLSACATAAEDASVDFASTDAERDEQARQAERHRRDSRMLENSIVDLHGILKVRTSSDLARAKQEAFDAVATDREQLVQEIATLWETTFPSLIDLLGRIRANDERISVVNANRPGNRNPLESAEAEARGVPGNFRTSCGGPIARLTAMKIPAKATESMLWPLPERAFNELMIEATARTARMDADRDRELKVRPYRLSHNRGGDMISIDTPGGKVGIPALTAVDVPGPAEIMLTQAQADAARDKGLMVEAMPFKQPAKAA